MATVRATDDVAIATAEKRNALDRPQVPVAPVPLHHPVPPSCPYRIDVVIRITRRPPISVTVSVIIPTVALVLTSARCISRGVAGRVLPVRALAHTVMPRHLALRRALQERGGKGDGMGGVLIFMAEWLLMALESKEADESL